VHVRASTRTLDNSGRHTHQWTSNLKYTQLTMPTRKCRIQYVNHQWNMVWRDARYDRPVPFTCRTERYIYFSKLCLPLQRVLWFQSAISEVAVTTYGVYILDQHCWGGVAWSLKLAEIPRTKLQKTLGSLKFFTRHFKYWTP